MATTSKKNVEKTESDQKSTEKDDEEFDLNRIPEFTIGNRTYKAKMSFAEMYQNFGFKRRVRKAFADKDGEAATLIALETLYDEDALESLDGLSAYGEEFDRVMSEIGFPTS